MKPRTPCRKCGTTERAAFRRGGSVALCGSCCPEGFRWCGWCQQARTHDQFAVLKTTGKPRGICRSCEPPRQAAWIAENPEYKRKWYSGEWKQRGNVDASRRSAMLRIRYAITRAKKRGIEFNMTPEFRDQIVAKFIAGHCELTGIPFSNSGGRYLKAFAPSLDRIVPERGYVPGNVRVVCWAVNAAMGSWGLDITLQVASALVAEDFLAALEAA